MLFQVDKLKDACVAVLRRGRQGVLGASNSLLLLSLWAYWRNFNPGETKIVPASIVQLQHPILTHEDSPCATDVIICTSPHAELTGFTWEH